MAAAAPPVEEGVLAPPPAPAGLGAATFDVEAPLPTAAAAGGGPESAAQTTKVVGSVMSERAEAWRDVGEAVGLATWGVATALDIALTVVLLSNGSTVWLGLLTLVTLLAPLCATAALVLTRNNWLAVALRYILGVLLMRGTAGMRLQCLAPWRVAQTAVAWMGLAGVGLMGALIALYLATCYSVTALLSVPVLDATLVLSSVPAIRRHVLRPDLVFLESYRQARYAAVAVLQSAPTAVITVMLLAAHVAGTRANVRSVGILPQGPGIGGGAALQAALHGSSRGLLANPTIEESVHLRRLQQLQSTTVPTITSQPPVPASPTIASGSIATPAPPAVAVAPPRGIDLAGLLVAAAQALAASGTLRVDGQQQGQQGQQPRLQLTPLYAPGPSSQPEPSSQVAAAIIAKSQGATPEASGVGAVVGPTDSGSRALGSFTWPEISTAVASSVPLWLLVLVMFSSLVNLATLMALLVVACRAAGLPILHHLPHVAKMRGGLRVLAPVAEEALAVMASTDRELQVGGCDGGCGTDDDCCSDDGTGIGSNNQGKVTPECSTGGLHSGLIGRRLLISSAWHWGCPPEGPGPWLPLVPRYLLPADGGWLGPGQMSRLATLAFRFYGCRAAGQATKPPATRLDSPPCTDTTCCGPSDGGPVVTALEVEHLGGTELGVVVPRGLAVLPHVNRIHLRWCELQGRAMRPVLGALAEHPRLTDLTLERCQVDQAAAELLHRLMVPVASTAQRTHLRAVRLVRCSLSVSAASTLANAVARAQGLHTFALSSATIEPTGSRTVVAASFARALRGAEGSLRHLTVGFSRGCPATAEALAAVVSEGAAPQGLRHVVLSRREVASRGLGAWAAALGRVGVAGGVCMPAGPGAAPSQLTLRAVALGPLGPRTGRTTSVTLRSSNTAAHGRVSGGSPAAEGAAGEVALQPTLSQPRRSYAGGRGVPADAPTQWVLTVEELPITLVVGADTDAALRGRWLDTLSRSLAQRSGAGVASFAHRLSSVLDTVPQPDAPAANPGYSGSQQGPVFMGGGLLVPSTSSVASPVASTSLEAPRPGSSSIVDAKVVGGSPHPAPRLVVLGSSDASDVVVCALKGLPLTTLDLEGLELGLRGGKLVAAALPQCTMLRSVDLSATGVGDEAALALAASLPHCQHLETVMLEANCITDRGAIALAEALEAGACPTLRQLSLGGNRFPLEWGTLLQLRNLATLRPSLWVQLLCPVAEAGQAAPREPSNVCSSMRSAATTMTAGGVMASSPTVLSRLLSSQRLRWRVSRKKARRGLDAQGSAMAATVTTAGSTSGGSSSGRGGSSDDSASAGSDENLCGVCFDRPNSLHVIGCGHQLCIPCYRRVVAPTGPGIPLSGVTPTCPFCRGRIGGFAYADAIHRAVTEHLGAASTVSGVSAPPLVVGSSC